MGSAEIGDTAGYLIEALSRAGFLKDETHANLKLTVGWLLRKVRCARAAHAGSAYPEETGPLRDLSAAVSRGSGFDSEGDIGNCCAHVSPQGGWQSYRAAYKGHHPGSPRTAPSLCWEPLTTDNLADSA